MNAGILVALVAALAALPTAAFASPTALPPLAPAEADAENSITYHGDLDWTLATGTSTVWPSNDVTITCVDGTCTVDWREAVFGIPPASFAPDDPRIVATTPSSGSVCQGNYIMAINVDVVADADRLTGTIELVDHQEDCDNDGSWARAVGMVAAVDFPRVAGNPCILDETRPECAPAPPATTPMTTPTPTVEAASGVDEGEQRESDTDDSIIPIVVIAVVGAGAAAAAAAAAAQGAKKRRGGGAPPVDSGSGPTDARSDLSSASGLFSNAMADAAARGGGADPGSAAPGERQRMLQNLQTHVEGGNDVTGGAGGDAAPAPGSDLSGASHLFEQAAADAAASGGEGAEPIAPGERQRMLQNLQNQVQNMSDEAGRVAEPPKDPE